VTRESLFSDNVFACSLSVLLFQEQFFHMEIHLEPDESIIDLCLHILIYPLGSEPHNAEKQQAVYCVNT
jgi:hypothetical protein